jgi:hypothetical protein
MKNGILKECLAPLLKTVPGTFFIDFMIGDYYVLGNCYGV